MTKTVENNLAKAARVLLVFLLVFWGSFRAEAFAYAALSKEAKGIGVEDVEEGDQLSDLFVYEIDPNPASGNMTGLGKEVARASAEGAPAVEITFDKPNETRDFVAVPAWNGKGASVDKNSGKIQIANFVKWDVKGEGATFEPNGKTPGIMTLTSSKAGTVTVICELDGDAKKKLDLEKFPTGVDDAPGTASFMVETKEPEVSKRVSELKISDAEGVLVSGTDVAKVLPNTQVGKPYSFKAEIKVTVLTGDATSYEPSEDGYYSLEDARTAGVAVTWSLASGNDIAHIDKDSGELTFDEAGTVSVHVEATIDEATTPADFEVKTEGAPASGPDDESKTGEEPGTKPGEEPEPEPEPVPVSQGESNPQATLTVVSNARVATATGDGGESVDGGEPGNASEEQASSSSSSSDESTSSSSQATDESDEQTQTVEKAYSVSDLEALGTGRATYTMSVGNEFVTVTGEGPYLVWLLRDIGIENTNQIDSLVFENADGVVTSVAWSELESANRYYPKAAEGNFEEVESVSPIIATKSLVRGYGDGTGVGPDAARVAKKDAAGSESSSAGDADSSSESNSTDDPGSSSASTSSSGDETPSSTSSSSSASVEADDDSTTPSEPELLDNTRFRLLFGSTSTARSIADPDALRYLKKITVNVKPATEEPEDPGFNTDIGVSVEYVPVPMGAPAVFSALPNTAIRDARFDFNWEVSTDNGKTWKQVENGNVQVLRVITTEERIGNKYRVVMSTDASDKDGRENVTVTSEPVTMEEGNGLAVVLEYDPPIAGKTAYFQTTLYGAKSGVGIKYTWQQSQDGGQHWSDIAGRSGSSLAVSTEPIDPNAEKAADDEVVPITYVRVIAEETSGDKRKAISEAVPLTVHVDYGTSPQGPALDSDDSPTTDPPKKDNPKIMQPVDDIVLEFPDDDDDDFDDDDKTPTVPLPNGTQTQQVNPSQLYINEDVTEAVHEQQEAIEEYVESNVPGARWTSLSTAQATDDDVRNILADNPFAPFVFPVGLGVTVAGGVEKLLFFRRQVK